MSGLDLRQPALVTDDFRRRVAESLVPLGFVAKAKGASLVRKRGRNTHRVAFSSSHYNTPGNVACFVAFWFEDGAVRKQVPGFRAGGVFGASEFPEAAPTNVANVEQAEELGGVIVDRLGFFDLLEEPARILVEVSARFVSGFWSPRLVVPYLNVHLGRDAVCTYARALLNGRPELWPAFASPRERRGQPAEPGIEPDEGTDLLRSMADLQLAGDVEVPPDVATSTKLVAANLRSFLGRQLRAWGEPDAAAALRRLDDEAVASIRAAQAACSDAPLVDGIAAARIALRLTTGEDRPPRRPAPRPRLFQYQALHDPFGA